jgi:hypothetical protein
MIVTDFDQAMRLGMEKVIEKLMDNPSGLSSTCPNYPQNHLLVARREDSANYACTVKEIVSSELPQPKVNKHLIALVSKKLVTKVNQGVGQACPHSLKLGLYLMPAGHFLVQMGRGLIGS